MMNLNVNPALGIVGLILLGSLGLYALIRVVRSNRFMRRRRRNYGKVVPRVKRRMIMLSVKDKKR